MIFIACSDFLRQYSQTQRVQQPPKNSAYMGLGISEIENPTPKYFGWDCIFFIFFTLSFTIFSIISTHPLYFLLYSFILALHFFTHSSPSSLIISNSLVGLQSGLGLCFGVWFGLGLWMMDWRRSTKTEQITTKISSFISLRT